MTAWNNYIGSWAWFMGDTQILAWKPKSKERPRFRRVGKSVVTYTSKGTVDAQNALAAQWNGPPAEGPLAVELVLANDTVGITISSCDDYKHRRLRADVDNYAKMILDALNGVAFEDDSQIVELKVRKT